MKKIFLILILFIISLVVGNKILGITSAYSYEINRSVLFYKEDKELLAEDIKVYLNNIDNYIIPNSSYLYSEKLVYNYDFLIRFAIDYILNNKEYYSKSIITFDECTYMNKEGLQNFTNDYVDLNKIYEITDFYFGIDDFFVINDDVCIKNNNYLSLSDYTNDVFDNEIEIVTVDVRDNEVDAYVTYDNKVKYLYSFLNDNNVLILVNVEVVS